MKRDVDQKLLEWKDKINKKCLLIDGARQVGKTYSIRKFGKESYRDFVEINLIDDTDAQTLFQTAKSSQDILMYLSIIAGKSLTKNNTLIFFDEVQVCPNLITLVKFLVEDGQYDYILSGSLLGIELISTASIPVGYMEIIQMYPMTFKEFAIANGVSQQIFDYLKQCFIEYTPVNEAIHSRLIDLFHLYIIVGGMPAAVAQYIHTNDLTKVIQEQQNIIQLYKLDISKYDPKNKLYITDIYDRIPSELAEQNKRFEVNSIKYGLKFDRVKNGFLWLTNAGVAHSVFCANEPTFPLMLSKSRNLLKLFLSDIGLLTSCYANNIQLKLLRKDVDINYGGIYENAVAQEMITNGLNLYYYKNNRIGEIDLLCEIDGEVVPIEVKSGKSYKKHSALNHLLNTYHYSKAYTLSNYNLSVEDNKIYQKKELNEGNKTKTD